MTSIERPFFDDNENSGAGSAQGGRGGGLSFDFEPEGSENVSNVDMNDEDDQEA